jgi:excisionase family DNA binding protein
LEANNSTRRRCGAGGTTTTQAPESDVLTLVQAADFLKCHPKTLRLMAVKKKIPSKRVGSHWRFYRPLLHAWMEEAA